MSEVGERFHRELSETEMEQILSAADRRPERDAVLVALWDLILREAEGLTWDEACAGGVKFHVSDYAIPLHQAALIQDALGPTSDMLWFNLGPASFEDGQTS